MIHRRTFLTLLAAPAIVRASSLMAISPVPKPMTGSEIERLQAEWEAECGRLAAIEHDLMVNQPLLILGRDEARQMTLVQRGRWPNIKGVYEVPDIMLAQFGLPL